MVVVEEAQVALSLSVGGYLQKRRYSFLFAVLFCGILKHPIVFWNARQILLCAFMGLREMQQTKKAEIQQ